MSKKVLTNENKLEQAPGRGSVNDGDGHIGTTRAISFAWMAGKKEFSGVVAKASKSFFLAIFGA